MSNVLNDISISNGSSFGDFSKIISSLPLSIEQENERHLTHAVNLCKSKSAHYKWRGVMIVQLLVCDTNILLKHGDTILSSLIQVLSACDHHKVITAAVDCLRLLCSNMKSSSSLVREVLTPKMGMLLTALTKKVESHPIEVSQLLQYFIAKHPTSFRPFAKLIKEKLLLIIENEKFEFGSSTFRLSICRTLGCLPIIEKRTPDEFWQQQVFGALFDLLSAFNLFDHFLEIPSHEINVSRFNLKDHHPILPSMHIDINSAASILQIPARIKVLFDLIQGYMYGATMLPVVLPVGAIVEVIRRILSIDSRYHDFKKEIRGSYVKDVIQSSLYECHQVALTYLEVFLDTFETHAVPHLRSLMAEIDRLADPRVKCPDSLLSSLVIRVATRIFKLACFYPEHEEHVRTQDFALRILQYSNQTLEQYSKCTSLVSSPFQLQSREQAIGCLEFVSAIIEADGLTSTNALKLTKLLVLLQYHNKVNWRDDKIEDLLLHVSMCLLCSPTMHMFVPVSLFKSITGNQAIHLPVQSHKTKDHANNEEEMDEKKTEVPDENKKQIQLPTEDNNVDQHQSYKRQKINSSTVESDDLFILNQGNKNTSHSSKVFKSEGPPESGLENTQYESAGDDDFEMPALVGEESDSE